MSLLRCLSPLYLICLWASTLSVLILLSSQDVSMREWLLVELSVITTLLLLALFAFRRKSGYSRVALALARADILMTWVFFALSAVGIGVVVAADVQPKPIHYAAFALILLYTPYQLFRLLTYMCGLWLLYRLQASNSSVSPEQPNLNSVEPDDIQVILQSPEECSSRQECEVDSDNWLVPSTRNSDAIALVPQESSLP